MILDDTYLGGKVVGIGRKRTDGSFEYKELEKPIHNRIVSKGIDNLLTYQGDSTLPPSSGHAVTSLLVMAADYSNTWGKGGVLTYSALGDNGGQTSFTDTGLHNKVTDITKNGSSDNPYCGMKSVGGRTEGFRVTHIHTIQSDGYIREVGWYKDVNDVYELFSRVVFDVPIEVTSGEELWITYELDMTYPETTVVTLPTLLDIDGNPLQAERASTRRSRAASSSWSYDTTNQPYPNFVCGRRVGGYTTGYVSQSNSGGWRDAWWSPIWTWKIAWNDYQGRAEYYRNYPFYMTSSNSQVAYTGDTSNQPTTQANVDATNIVFRKILDYTPGTFYRDAVITLGSDWPNMTTESYVDVSQLILNGTSYRFGHYETDSETGEQVWVPQYWRKQRGRMVALTLRQRYITPDTQV